MRPGSTSPRPPHGSAERRRWVVLAAALVSALVVLNVVAFAGLAQLYPWMTLWDDDTEVAAAPAPAPERRTVPTLQVPEGSTPAEEVVRRTAEVVPKALSRKKWRATPSSAGVTPTALAFGCDPPAAPIAMVGRSRGWVASSGPLPTDVSGSVSVSVQAYGAGGGGLALAQLSDAVSACSSTYLTSAPDIGVQTVGFSSPDFSTLAWRRGDVLVTMRFQQSQGPGSVATLTPWARAYDEQLRTLLGASCLDQDAPVEASVRSPYLQPKRYVGRREFQTVRLQVPEGARTAEELTDATVRPIPAPDLGVPSEPYRPAAPAEPRYPEFLPAYVERPVLPSAPEPAPTKARAGKPIADPEGPGCGWEFTGQAAPRFDASEVESIFAERRDAAQQRLQRQWRRWQQAQADYWEAYDSYASRAPAYRTYVEQTNAVAAAWAQIQAQRDAYASALAARQNAIAARKQFFADQEKAQKRYDAAVEECRQAAAAPPPDEKGDKSEKPGKGNAKKSDEPAAEKQPSGPQCPPERPAILDEEPPTVPPEPTPPPDPRP